MSQVTLLLEKWNAGDEEAMNALMSLVYDELKGLARARMISAGVAVEPTVLVHEAYLSLANQGESKLTNRAQFFAVAARIMRRVLVDQARERNAEKRGGGVQHVTLSHAVGIHPSNEVDPLIFDEALSFLAQIDEKQSQVVELRVFGGLKMEEIAYCLNLGEATVYRSWKLAKAWLHRYFTGRLETAV